MIPFLLVCILLAGSLAPAPADEPPDFGRFTVWIRDSERVFLDLPALGIAQGFYGPALARARLSSASSFRMLRILAFTEVPLPNIPGRLRLFMVRLALAPDGPAVVLFAYFAREGAGPAPGTGLQRLDGWLLVRLEQAGRP